MGFGHWVQSVELRNIVCTGSAASVRQRAWKKIFLQQADFHFSEYLRKPSIWSKRNWQAMQVRWLHNQCFWQMHFTSEPYVLPHPLGIHHVALTQGVQSLYKYCIKGEQSFCQVSFPGVTWQAFMQHFTAGLSESAKNHIFALLKSGSYQQTRVLYPTFSILTVLLQQKKASIWIFRPLLFLKIKSKS